MTNRQTALIFGYNQDELQGMSVEQMIQNGMKLHSQEKKSDQESDAESAADSATTLHAGQGLRKDGTRFPIELALAHLPTINGQSGSICISVRDVTQQHKIQNLISQQRATFATLFDALPEVISLKDAEGTYLTCNSSFAKMIGLPVERVIGHRTEEIFPVKIGELIIEKDGEVMATLQKVSFEEWMTYADGHRALHETTKLPCTDEKGRLLGVLTVSQRCDRGTPGTAGHAQAFERHRTDACFGGHHRSKWRN